MPLPTLQQVHVFDPPAAFVGTPTATTTVIGAFATDGTLSWNGSPAHVAIFDRALSAAEVLSLGVL